VGGLITPYRTMTMESAAGKNPVSHVGKLYAVVAHRVAEAIVERVADVESASCLLASRIGRPIDRPRLADVQLGMVDGADPAQRRHDVEEILAAELAEAHGLWRKLLAREVPLF